MLDFSDVFELGSASEFIRQSDSADYMVKGKSQLIETINHLLADLIRHDIEDEFVLKSMYDWAARLERNYKKGQKISKKNGKELSEETNRWQDLIYKELCGRPCIEYRKGALNQKALILTSEGLPGDIFELSVWKKLPKIAQSDFSDSAKCLLIGASTPAAMVVLRGMEAVIRQYYALRTKKEAGRNLGIIIKELSKVQGVNKKLIGYIDYIRSEKRNIAQHPDKVFTQREAERMFMEIVNATHDIYADTLFRS